ncbi:MAG: flagellar hook-basal body complex protein, partial [Gemmatimonadetes bacterium]|nr:flagellar hook-basal body complex protein [Gemmatimonadota bacterium]
MMRSLFAAVSGLRNHQLSLNVIGNNISNINTIGFKSGRALFQEMLSETIQGASRPNANRAGTNPVQVGLGMAVASVDSRFSQGQLELTGNMLDMAVQGDGFFVMRDGGREYFGRAGAFGFDGDGRLTAGQGLLVQGWLANEDGVLGSSTALTDIALPFGQKSPARATESIRLQSNLDASADALSTITRTGALRALAQPTDNLTSLFDSSGRPLGVQDGDVVTVSFAGTADTRVSDLSIGSMPMDLLDGDVITVNDGTGTATITFDDTWTLSTFAQQVQAALASIPTGETDIAVSVNADGSLGFDNPAGGNARSVTVSLSVAGRDAFNQFVDSVPVINGTSTARSEATSVRESFTHGSQFQNVNDLAASIQSALNLGSAGAAVSFIGGQFVYDNSVGSQDLVNVSIERNGATTSFTEAMGLSSDNLSIGETRQSDRLLDVAAREDNIADLYSAQGVHLGLATGDLFTFDSQIGGAQSAQATFSVVNTGDGGTGDRIVQSLGGLLDELEDVLGLTIAGGAD